MPALLYLLVVFIVPLASMVGQSVTSPSLGLTNYAAIARNPAYAQIGLQTVLIGVATTVLCFAIGYPLAYFIATARPSVRGILLLGVAAPYLMSVLVRTFAWEVLLGDEGVVARLLRAAGMPNEGFLFTSGAVIVSLVHILLPVMVLPLVSVMHQVDPAFALAARSLGAGPARTFTRVFLPLTVPGIQVGSVLVFVYGIGSFITPQILGGRAGTMLGVIIQRAIDQLADWGFAAAVAVVLMTLVGAVLGIFQWRLAGSLEWILAGSVAPRRAFGTDGEREHERSSLSRVVDAVAGAVDGIGISRSRAPLAVWSALAVIFLLLPQLIALPISLSSTRTLIFPPPGYSLQWYRAFFGPDWLPAATVSVVVGLAAALAATALGTLAGISVSRAFGPRTQLAIGGLLLLPLVIPSVVTAVALYLVFAPLGLTDSVLGIALAHVAIALPFAFTIVYANARSLDPTYERAAASLGAGTAATLRRVILPLIRPGIAVALFFTFLTSFDEAVIAIFLSGVHVKTLPRRMFEAITLESDPTIGVVATLSITLTVLVIAGSALVQRSSTRGSLA